MIKTALVFASFMICACLPAPSEPEPEYLTNEPIYVFTPGPGAEEFTAQAMARLSDATGLPFRSGPGGIDVRLSEQPYSMDDKGEMQPRCGVTPVFFEPLHPWQKEQEVRIADVYVEVKFPPVDCWDDVSRSIEHEAIHAIRRVINARNDADDHSASGVFQAWSGLNDRMDTASLIKVCEAVPCVKFEIEE